MHDSCVVACTPGRLAPLNRHRRLAAYVERGRYDELADERYTDAGAIFDIMAVTVIQHHHSSAP